MTFDEGGKSRDFRTGKTRGGVRIAFPESPKFSSAFHTGELVRRVTTRIGSFIPHFELAGIDSEVWPPAFRRGIRMENHRRVLRFGIFSTNCI